ncbi:uncharacterized protein PHACADRAFT_252470 [Phanerochaete carnosa HHB-10118-sp]|uniref:Uncharacterized protein n=1 Tax=Phanerochaete carnosa (strain HHB-10118-sp) TaxID=650164 RepID=K5W313_PHACS|nr:uncharacterized protein PHACADRAFT_252470 [Phanerochaete carnosa HHB-10118-sp]EKM58268.1 hypothetical protein PHACADRAFT_252470 [Phanerochaete carnosa HHB-10118-sp]
MALVSFVGLHLTSTSHLARVVRAGRSKHVTISRFCPAVYDIVDSAKARNAVGRLLSRAPWPAMIEVRTSRVGRSLGMAYKHCRAGLFYSVGGPTGER